MIDIDGKLINPAHIISAEIETRHYANGSASQLVVHLNDGSRITWDHAYGFNAFAALDKIKRYSADALTELQAAALKVVEETDRIHDGSPWPLKYRAPYGAIVELRALLAKQLGAR